MAYVDPVPVVTVTVEVPPFSAMARSLTDISSTGAKSSSSMTIDCCAPTATAPMAASMSMVSASSSILSSTPVTIVVTVETSSPEPAGRVRDFDTMV